jgi:nucleotide-binding universal stress UspA family protein
METKILVPLDGSHLSEQSLPYAMTLGQRLPAELVLLSAVSIPSDTLESLEKAGLEPEPLFEELEIKAGEYLEALAHLLSKAELSASHVVLRSRAAEAIVEYAEQADIQLIVVASHGYAGIARWTHGSVVERVLQSAPIPVLLVRAKEGIIQGLRRAVPVGVSWCRWMARNWPSKSCQPSSQSQLRSVVKSPFSACLSLTQPDRS